MEEARQQMKEAQRAYNRMRYKEDEQYRERIRNTMRERYKAKRKTADCKQCGKRKPVDAEVCVKCVLGSLNQLKASKPSTEQVFKSLAEMVKSIESSGAN